MTVYSKNIGTPRGEDAALAISKVPLDKKVCTVFAPFVVIVPPVTV